MGLFYAYARRASSIPFFYLRGADLILVAEDHNDWGRFLIVFASREVADEWWRTVSSPCNESLSRSIRRTTPQFYTYSDDAASIFLANDRDRFPQFSDRVFMTLMDDTVGRTLSVIPTQNITDHVSGKSYFIRSKADPPEYWYCPRSSGNITQGTKIFASREERTRFRVRIVDERMGDGTIMIGTDEIHITPVSASGLSVRVGEDGCLAVTGGYRSRLRFSDLKNGFTDGDRCLHLVEAASPPGIQQLDTITVKEIVEAQEGMGEEWELSA